MSEEFGIGNRIVDTFSGPEEEITWKPSIYHSGIDVYSLQVAGNLEDINFSYEQMEELIL